MLPKRRTTIKSNFTFILFIILLFDTYLNLSTRIDGLYIIRPTLMLTILIAISLLKNAKTFQGISEDIVFKAMNIFILYLVISLPLVEYSGSVIRNNISDFIKVIAFFYFAALIIDTPKRLAVFLIFFVGLQVFRGIEPLYLNITEGYWGDSTHIGSGEFAQRLSGSPYDVVNPNGLGFVIVTAIPYLHYLLLPKGLMSKILYFCILSLLFYALLLTMSRGGIVALLVIGWFIFKESKQKVLIVLFVLGFMVVGWSQIDSFQKDRYLSLIGMAKLTQNEKTSSGRLTGMLNEFVIGFSRPIVGHGIGTTQEAKYHVTGGSKASHNMYGELLIEAGLIGLLLFIRYVLAIKKTLNNFKTKINDNNELSSYLQIYKALLAVLVMFAVYSVNYFGVSQYYWYLLGGLVVAINRIMASELAESTSK